MEEKSKDIEIKLSTAEQNREKEIQKKLDFVKKEVRFVYHFYFHLSSVFSVLLRKFRDLHRGVEIAH